MKRHVLMIVMMMALSFGLMAADVLENSATPGGSQNPGRTVNLTEALRISDEGGEFLFKRPGRIKIAPDGSIFVRDDNQLFKFSPDGKFSARMIKTGEGPGEVKYLGDYLPQENQIIASGFMPTKIIKLNPDGSFNSEFRVNSSDSFFTFITKYKDKYYFSYQKLDFQSAKTGVQTSDTLLMTANEKGETTPLEFKTPVKSAMIKVTNKNGVQISMSSITSFDSVVVDKHLFASSTERYLCHLLDLETGKAVKQFRRPYTPVPYYKDPEETQDAEDNKLTSMYKREHFNDILRLIKADDKLWVVTSTLDKDKGILVDVYDTTGKYIDNFHLKLPNLTNLHDPRLNYLIHHQGHIYTIEKDDEDASAVVKYKIEKS